MTNQEFNNREMEMIQSAHVFHLVVYDGCDKSSGSRLPAK